MAPLHTLQDATTLHTAVCHHNELQHTFVSKPKVAPLPIFQSATTTLNYTTHLCITRSGTPHILQDATTLHTAVCHHNELQHTLVSKPKVAPLPIFQSATTTLHYTTQLGITRSGTPHILQDATALHTAVCHHNCIVVGCQSSDRGLFFNTQASGWGVVAHATQVCGRVRLGGDASPMGTHPALQSATTLHYTNFLCITMEWPPFPYGSLPPPHCTTPPPLCITIEWHSSHTVVYCIGCQLEQVEPVKSHGWSFADLYIVAVVDLDSALLHPPGFLPPPPCTTPHTCVQQGVAPLTD